MTLLTMEEEEEDLVQGNKNINFLQKSVNTRPWNYKLLPCQTTDTLQQILLHTWCYRRKAERHYPV